MLMDRARTASSLKGQHIRPIIAVSPTVWGLSIAGPIYGVCVTEAPAGCCSERPGRFSVGILMGQYNCCSNQDPDVEPNTPIADVPDIALDPLFHQVYGRRLTA
jgi:hypothetical protein